jgi:diacylglycerol O-acyltransferase
MPSAAATEAFVTERVVLIGPGDGGPARRTLGTRLSGVAMNGTATVAADHYMRDSDAFSWYMEADPLLRSTVVSVLVLDSEPDAERLLERAERGARLSPRFRHRVVEVPMRLANPRWVVDDDFDLEFHTRRIGAPHPGRLEDVFAFACQTGMAGLDRDRALWEFTLVEGVEGGRAALVMKMHHALTDGVGGMQLATNLLDLEADPGPLGPMPDVPVEPSLSTAGLVRDALVADAGRARDLATDLVRNAPAALASALRHPVATTRHGMGVAQSIARTVQPVTNTMSPVMQRRRLAWHYDTLAVPLDALRASAHRAGYTLNDAFLAALTGGLLRYHESHGAIAEHLRLTMPISLRQPGDPAGGNRITLMRFAVPTRPRDPVERMQRIHELCLAERAEPAIAYTNQIAGALNLLPRTYVGGMLKHVDFLASNVPGIDRPVYLAGARVKEWYAFGPTIGAALNVTMISYAGTCYVGCNVDLGAVPDPAAMQSCLHEGFDEVIAA